MDHHQAQRLSLSLGSHMLLPSNSHSVQYVSDDYSFMGNALASSSNSLAAIIGNSRYLKPAQSLLEDIVSIGGKSVGIKLCCNGLMSPDKHEFQAKIASLITMLEEVEEKFEKSYHQNIKWKK
ncbi:hypothetical protein M0R45_006434 [Rubus argutus]|uniref:Uncharacterized protein n=1 Tax=Rubus argutus TaxID=59490 RepID=A0AAW1YQL3_RUBAR